MARSLTRSYHRIAKHSNRCNSDTTTGPEVSPASTTRNNSHGNDCHMHNHKKNAIRFTTRGSHSETGKHNNNNHTSLGDFLKSRQQGFSSAIAKVTARKEAQAAAAASALLRKNAVNQHTKPWGYHHHDPSPLLQFARELTMMGVPAHQPSSSFVAEQGSNTGKSFSSRLDGRSNSASTATTSTRITSASSSHASSTTTRDGRVIVGVLKKPSVGPNSRLSRRRIWKRRYGNAKKSFSRRSSTPKKMVVILDQPTVVYDDDCWEYNSRDGVVDEDDPKDGESCSSDSDRDSDSSSTSSTASTEEMEDLSDDGVLLSTSSLEQLRRAALAEEQMRAWYRQQVEEDLIAAAAALSLHHREQSNQSQQEDDWEPKISI